MFNIDQNCRAIRITKTICACLERGMSVSLEPCQQQMVFDGDASQNRAITRVGVAIGLHFSWSQHLPDFQPTYRAAHNFDAAWIRHGIYRSESANLAEHSDTYKVFS